MEDLWWRSRLLQISGRHMLSFHRSWKFSITCFLISVSLGPHDLSSLFHSTFFFLHCRLVLWSFTDVLYMYGWKCWLLSCVLTLCDPMDSSHQASLSIGFSRQEYWSGWPCPSPGDLPDSGFELGCLALQADSLPSEPPGSFTDVRLHILLITSKLSLQITVFLYFSRDKRC